MILIRKLRQHQIAIFAFIITAIALFAVFNHIDIEAFARNTRRVPTESIFLAGLFLLIGAFLAVIRLWFIAADVGHHLSARDTMLALSLGQLAGAATIQFFGQIVTRTALLSKRGVTAPVNIAIATYERLIAVLVSLLLAIGGAWFLFGSVALDLKLGGEQLIVLGIGVLCALLAGAIFGWGSVALHQFRLHVSVKMALSLVRTAVITLFIQITTATSYVVLATSLAPDISTAQLFAASLVVMFAASLPISFAGWGIRELSAVVALTAIGVQAPVAVAVAVLVGALALLAVILVAGLAVLMPPLESALATNPVVKKEINIESLIKWLVPLMTATAVFFQVYIPTGTKEINVNLADPLAILGGFIFCLYYLGSRWRIVSFDKYVFATSAVIVAGYLHGYFRFGWIDWSFTNKLVGWFVLLGYGATGALIVKRFGKNGLLTLTRTFAAVAAGLVAMFVLMTAIEMFGFNIPDTVFQLPLAGFSQNRNAFAFILLMAIATAPLLEARYRPIILALLFVGIALTGSRAGAGALAMILILAVFLKGLRVKDLAKSTVFAGMIFGSLWVIPHLSLPQFSTSASAPPKVITQSVLPFGNTSDGSDAERLTSIRGGLDLFKANPIIGAGLGAYLVEQPAKTLHIIHSTAVWLLAEFGLIGLLVFAFPALRILLQEGKSASTDHVSAFIVLVLMSFAIMSLVHEMLYQRAMWILLGAGLAWVPPVISRRNLGSGGRI